MSWHSPNPYFRSPGRIIEVKNAYAMKRKSSHHPTQNEEGRLDFLGSTNSSSDGDLPPNQNPEETNPSSNYEVHPSQNPEIEDEAQRTTNPSSSDHEYDFERRTKSRLDRPVPPPQKTKGKLASSRRTKAKIDRPAPATQKTRGQLASEGRTKARHDHPVPPTENREDGTFTTRLHYNGVMEAEEGCGKQYLNGLLEYIHKCDPDKWSKLEVDDVLEKLGLDVCRLEYFYQMPGMNLDEGLVRLFDNKSSVDMAEIGVKARVIDVYAVEGVQQGVSDMGGATEVPVSQLTQDHKEIPVGGRAARKLLFEGQQDGLTASENDSESDGDEGKEDELVVSEEGEYGEQDEDGEENEDGEDDWLLGSEEGEDQGAVDSDGDEEEGKAINRKKKTKSVVVGKGKGKVGAGVTGKGKVGAGVKGKSKIGDGDKGKGKVGDRGKRRVGAVDKGKAIDKGKAKVGAAEDNVEQPSFVDSDYDLSDKEEDNIMAAQVEGWKNVVDSMRNIGDGDGGDGGTSDDLPSDSPSSGTDSDDDLGDGDSDVAKILSRRYKASTDLNDPKWEVGLRFKCCCGHACGSHRVGCC